MSNDVDEITMELTAFILSSAKLFVPIREYSFPKSSHPWLNDKCIDLVAKKHAAQGTPDYELIRDKCTKGLLHEFQSHSMRMKSKISGLPTSSKKWWKLCNSLMIKKNCPDHIPPLRKDDGSWALSALEKGEALSESFQKKFHLPPNLETEAPTIDENFEYGFLLARKRWTHKLLSKLSESSATGPDGLPSIILKKCARELA